MIEYRARPSRKCGYYAQHRSTYEDWSSAWSPHKQEWAIWRPTPKWAIRALVRKDIRSTRNIGKRAQRRMRRADRARRASA